MSASNIIYVQKQIYESKQIWYYKNTATTTTTIIKIKRKEQHDNRHTQ